jgi:hypothetical protein
LITAITTGFNLSAKGAHYLSIVPVVYPEPCLVYCKKKLSISRLVIITCETKHNMDGFADSSPRQAPGKEHMAPANNGVQLHLLK